MKATTLVFLVSCGLTAANPLAGPGRARNGLGFAYISYEKVVVEISPTTARFKGMFMFRAAAGVTDYSDSPLSVPVWLPSASTSDLSVSNFWRFFARTGLDGVGNFQERQAFERTVGMNIIAAGEPRRSIYGWFAETGASERVPELSPEPGWSVLWCESRLGGEVTRGSRPVTITYNQPLLETNGERRFLYVPIFAFMPKHISTASTNTYSLILRADPECSISGTNGEIKFKVKPGGTVTLSLMHLRPIRAVVKHGVNVSASGNSRPAAQFTGL